MNSTDTILAEAHQFIAGSHTGYEAPNPPNAVLHVLLAMVIGELRGQNTTRQQTSDRQVQNWSETTSRTVEPSGLLTATNHLEKAFERITKLIDHLHEGRATTLKHELTLIREHLVHARDQHFLLQQLVQRQVHK